MRAGTYVFKKEKKWELLKGDKIYQVAEKLGVCQSYFYNVLNGKKACKKTYANTIMSYLGTGYKFEEFFDEIK